MRPYALFQPVLFHILVGTKDNKDGNLMSSFHGESAMPALGNV